MLYVYGVTRAGRGTPGIKGLGSPPGDVVLLESGPVAAAVTELPDDVEIQDEDARTHLHVLIDLLDGGPVLPLRMGTLSPDADAVRTELLDAAREPLLGQLDALDGAVELHVDADDDETEAIAEIARTAGLRPVGGGDLQSALDLGHEIAEILVESRRQLADEIVGELRPFAVRDVPRSIIQNAEDPVLRWAFLVNRDRIAEFDQAVATVRSQHPKAAIRYVGPLPPSHFVEWGTDSETNSESTDDVDSFSAHSSWAW